MLGSSSARRLRRATPREVSSLRCVRLAVLALTFFLATATHAQELDALAAAGDAAFERRAEGQVEGRATAEPIGEAVRSFERATRMAPERLDLQWRLLRALHYEADFASSGTDQERQRYRVGADRGDAVIARLVARLGAELDELDDAALMARAEAAGVTREDMARVYFWAAVHWGGWAREAGLLQAVRVGVANTMYAYTSLAVRLDAGLERGGPLRLLSRMHATLPRVPLITGWVDPAQAIPLAERALTVLPNDIGNRFLLALTQEELLSPPDPSARRTLEAVAKASPRPELVIEDLLVILEARELLAPPG